MEKVIKNIEKEISKLKQEYSRMERHMVKLVKENKLLWDKLHAANRKLDEQKQKCSKRSIKSKAIK